MKTHILQLEPHDDLLSTRDKMGWGKDGRIILVWPERGKLLARRLDIIMIKRRSQELGAPLALVTRDRQVRSHAYEQGIPVFRTIKQAQESQWRTPRRYRHTQGKSAVLDDDLRLSTRRTVEELIAARPPTKMLMSPVLRLIFFTVGVLAFLSIAAMLLPGAAVTLTPQSQTQTIQFIMKADPAVKTPAVSGDAPAVMKTIVVEGHDSVPATGSVMIADQAATGTVQFTNLTDQSIKIPAGLVVRSMDRNQVEFATMQAGTVLPGPGQFISMTVRAISPGSAGNLPAGSLQAIEGQLGTQLAATNPQPTFGGTDRKAPAPRAIDRQRLHERLEENLQQTAVQELIDSLQPGDLLIANSLTLKNTLSETFTPAGLQPADLVNLELRLEFQALVVEGEPLNQLAVMALDANVPQGFTPLPEKPDIQPLSDPILEADGSASWQIQASRTLLAQTPENKVVQLSLGLQPQTAISRLEQAFLLSAPPQITVTPGWWPRMPAVPFRIKVNIQPPAR